MIGLYVFSELKYISFEQDAHQQQKELIFC